jgi:hypothetical protein
MMAATRSIIGSLFGRLALLLEGSAASSGSELSFPEPKMMFWLPLVSGAVGAESLLKTLSRILANTLFGRSFGFDIV